MKNEFEASEENALKYSNLNFEWIITNDIVSDEFVHELKKVEENSAIISLYPIHFKDVKWLGYDDINKGIKNYTNQIPIYACLSYGITEGVIGGKVINHYNQSKSATEMLLKIINEETTKQLYIGDDSINDYIFDYETLKEYNIKKWDLPKGSIILNNPNDIIYKYPDIVISLIFLFVGLICIIITLICYIRYKIRYEKKLLKAKYAAEETNRLKAHFVSNISHELKTPIALIQGYAEGLVENVNSDGESRKFYAEVILDEANRMDKLVKQLLELMKLEYGKREFNNQKIDIVEITKEVIRKCNVMLKENNIEVEFENKEPIYVFADEFYIEQVITNYFTNAIKHCDEINGKKKITVKIKENNNNKVHFSIFNTGENIAEEDLDRIWVRFYKVDSSRNREAGGSGIGLALVKAIMNNYDCKYGVNNKENGVEFYFELNQLQENA